jgi:hypothetical protein
MFPRAKVLLGCAANHWFHLVPRSRKRRVIPIPNLHSPPALNLFTLPLPIVFICIYIYKKHLLKNSTQMYVAKWKNSHYRPDRSWGFQGFEAPRFQDNQHINVETSAVRKDRLYPQENITVTRFFWSLCQPKGHSTVGKIVTENSHWQHNEPNSRPSGF